MIRKKSERAKEVRRNMRGGAGEVEIRHYFAQDEINGPCRLCAELTIPPGSGIGEHEHADEDEIFIIQRGKGLIVDGGRESEVTAGDCVLTGRGSSHSIRNIGSDTLTVTAVIIKYKK